MGGDHDRFGVESTGTGHDVALDVDNAIRAYLTGKPTENQSLLHEGGTGSREETFGSVAADQAEEGNVLLVEDQGFFDIPELAAESAGPGMAVAAENPKAASFIGKTKATLKRAFSPRGFIRVGGSHGHQA